MCLLSKKIYFFIFIYFPAYPLFFLELNSKYNVYTVCIYFIRASCTFKLYIYKLASIGLNIHV